MISVRDGDHALGLELQIEELVEQQRRAELQGRTEDAQRLGAEISALQLELADTAERAATRTDEAEVPGPPSPAALDADGEF